MKVQALRGVCVGVEKHLAPGDTAEVDAGTARFLIGIGAVQEAPAEEPPPPEPAAPAAKPAKKEA